MSPSMKSKSKSKEKASARARKDQQKCSPKTSVTTNHGSGIPTTAYNPISGTFHTLETSLVASSAPLHENSHFLKIDDIDDHSSSPRGTVSECDSFSNNGSCSGESEDHKEKVANSSMRPDTIPGCDNERREKIRMKNERKHQRQRERRAQELHDRCSGYLMSRKLEALSQELVAMGFSFERATLALMLNDGKLEESVSWLFEGSEDKSCTKDTATNLLNEGNLKINISKELSQISAMEVRYNCSKQEVERVVIACEGDIQKAENTLKSSKHESLVIQPKSEDSAQNNSLVRSQGLPTASVSMPQRGNEYDFYYSKVGTGASMLLDPESKNLQSLHLNHPNEPTEKRWDVTGSNPSNMLMMLPSMQAPSSFAKVDAKPSALWNEGRMIQQGFGKEQLVMMQQPQFKNAKQNSIASINVLSSGTEGWYVNNIRDAENARSNGRLLQYRDTGNAGTQHIEEFCQAPYNEYSNVFGPINNLSARTGGFYKAMRASSLSPSATIRPKHQGSWSASASSPELTFPPSLGLFSGHHNAADRTLFSSHSHVDWNNGGLMPKIDYTNIDWTFYMYPKSGGLWFGISSFLRNSSGNKMIGSSACMSRLQNGGMVKESSSSSVLREWTTPFAGKDMFSVPRQLVTPTPL
ncbi:hypothetical protein Lal_00019816 [Lupinus albus]|uniref:Uncharacterized protein n=1 Tax=Lupinus albus TaxID=3870 RepID=A0A6A4R448_LUPAL|nr:hypothetical protein Lalb_Chr01g0007511 [Lupinus albus]KAF1899686.1 hypothetical protein Lal_00019816 [Lupinus albus]